MKKLSQMEQDENIQRFTDDDYRASYLTAVLDIDDKKRKAKSDELTDASREIMSKLADIYLKNTEKNLDLTLK